MNSIPEAIEQLGGLTKAGRALGVSKAVVNQWRLRNRVPVPYCPEIEKLTGVPCKDLNDSLDWELLRRRKK